VAIYIPWNYAPYPVFDAFHRGWDAYMAGDHRSALVLPDLTPYGRDTVDAQAYDRGMEAAMRWRRMGHED
jgi:hypothetical protein